MKRVLFLMAISISIFGTSSAMAAAPVLVCVSKETEVGDVVRLFQKTNLVGKPTNAFYAEYNRIGQKRFADCQRHPVPRFLAPGSDIDIYSCKDPDEGIAVQISFRRKLNTDHSLTDYAILRDQSSETSYFCERAN